MTSKEAHLATITVMGIIIAFIAAVILVMVLFGPYGLVAILGLAIFFLLYPMIYSDFKRHY